MRFLFVVFLLFSIEIAHSQTKGAKPSAMAGTSLTTVDAFAASNSVAASAFVSSAEIGLFFSNRLLLAELSAGNLSAVQDIRHGAFSYHLDYFGYAQYNTIKTGIGYAHSFGKKLAIGLRFNTHRIAIHENGSKMAVSFDLGCMYRINQEINIAVELRNPIKQKLESYYKESLPTQLNLGASYQPNTKLSLTCEFQKELSYPMRFSIGLDYKIHSLLSIRSGMAIHPILLSGGIGIALERLSLDISSTWDTRLGYSPQISLSYAFLKQAE